MDGLFADREMDKTFCEFFAGIGLVHEALQASDWRCGYANDISPQKAAMYRDRFGDAAYYHVDDVWATDEVISRVEGAPFLATASFPCTDMSLAGRRQGFGGAESSAFFGFAKAVAVLGERQPRMLMLENVVGFLYSRAGADFQAAVQSLADMGYWVDALILDAKQFLPQSRARLFVFGYHESLQFPELVRQTPEVFGDRWNSLIETTALRNDRLRNLMRNTELSTGWAALPLVPPVRAEYRLEDYLDSGDDQDWWDGPLVEKHLEMMSPMHRNEVDAWIASDQVRMATVFRRIRQGAQRAEVRRDGVAGCLRTPRGGSARQIVICAGRGRFRIRWMSPREYARLQGAPDFPLNGSDSQSLFGFGDAVCVPVIRWIDANILTPSFESACVAGGRVDG